MKLLTQPLTQDSFEPFGQVFTAPEQPGRDRNKAKLENLRAAAPPILSVFHVEPSPMPLTIDNMERHEFSSQSFMPLDVVNYLAVVAPPDSAGKLDPNDIRAFVVRGDQCLNFNANTWHYRLTTLDGTGRFATLTWQDGGNGDTVFVPLEDPIEISLGPDT